MLVKIMGILNWEAGLKWLGYLLALLRHQEGLSWNLVLEKLLEVTKKFLVKLYYNFGQLVLMEGIYVGPLSLY